MTSRTKSCELEAVTKVGDHVEAMWGMMWYLALVVDDRGSGE